MDMSKLEYPYIKYIKSLDKEYLFNLVFLFKPVVYDNLTLFKNMKFDKFYTKYCIIEENWDKNIEINTITDLFTEKVRVKCSFSGYKSPFEYWSNNKKNLVSKTEKDFGIVNVYNLRETIYKSVKLCNNFRITLALTILDIFKPTKWLDISSGWGDRLLSAIFYSHLNEK